MHNIKATAKNAAALLLFCTASLLAACGGGSSTSAAVAVGNATPKMPSVALEGATRIVASTRYDYSAVSSNLIGPVHEWAWGDGTIDKPATSGINKVWYTPGVYDIAVTSTGSNAELTSSRAATVIGTPVTSSSDHTCAIRADNTVVCWGTNIYGQLGNGTQVDSTVPVLVKGISQAIAVSSNGNQTCAVLADNTVWCWGGSFDPAFPIVITKLPKQVVGLNDVMTVVSGSFHHCALKKDGTVWCWGYDGAPVFGNGPASASETQTPVRVNAVRGAVAIGAGDQHTCAVVAPRGLVQCWGNNNYGQTGGVAVSNLSGRLPLETELPIFVPGVVNAVSLSVLAATSCAVIANGGMQCWGDNARGQFATGSGVGIGFTVLPPLNFKPQVVTTPVSGLAAAALGYNACALKTDKTVSCWGDYQAAVGTHSTPVEATVTQLGKDNAFVSSGATTCALKTDGRLFCRGVNDVGQLGNGTFIDSTVGFTEVLLGSLTTSTALVNDAVAVGESGFACAIRDDKTVACWGLALDISSNVPVVKGGLTGIKAISAGGSTACVIQADDTVACWGANAPFIFTSDIGLLGNGTTYNFYTSAPIQVANLVDVKSISVSRYHTCALKYNGKVVCWGNDLAGQLGRDQLSTQDAYLPAEVVGLSGVVSLSSTNFHNCAVTSSARVWCWGMGQRGEIGNGANSSVRKPTLVAGPLRAKSVSMFGNGACAIDLAGLGVCWGRGEAMQLGNGTTAATNVPGAAVQSTEPFLMLAGGAEHVCGISQSKAVLCWGRGGVSGFTRLYGPLSNSYGLAGTGNNWNSTTPVSVAGQSNVVGLSSNSGNSCSLKFDGTVWCWGQGGQGQLGNGFNADSNTVPVLVVGFKGLTVRPELFWH